MVSPARIVNHSFDQLDELIEKSHAHGHPQELKELITELKVMVLDQKDDPIWILRRYLRILDHDDPLQMKWSRRSIME